MSRGRNEELVRRIEALLTDVGTRLGGIELVAVELARDTRRSIIRVYIDREGGVPPRGSSPGSLRPRAACPQSGRPRQAAEGAVKPVAWGAADAAAEGEAAPERLGHDAAAAGAAGEAAPCPCSPGSRSRIARGSPGCSGITWTATPIWRRCSRRWGRTCWKSRRRASSGRCATRRTSTGFGEQAAVTTSEKILGRLNHLGVIAE